MFLYNALPSPEVQLSNCYYFAFKLSRWDLQYLGVAQMAVGVFASFVYAKVVSPCATVDSAASFVLVDSSLLLLLLLPFFSYASTKKITKVFNGRRVLRAIAITAFLAAAGGLAPLLFVLDHPSASVRPFILALLGASIRSFFNQLAFLGILVLLTERSIGKIRTTRYRTTSCFMMLRYVAQRTVRDSMLC